MESSGQRKLIAVGDYLFMRRSCLQLAITFSLFSLLVSVSWVASGTVTKSYVYIKFNPFFSSFFTHTLERKYMFLIFNGILAFLASSSGSSSSVIRSSISPQSTASYVHYRDERVVEAVLEDQAVAGGCDEIDDGSDVEEEAGTGECEQDEHVHEHVHGGVEEEMKVEEGVEEEEEEEGEEVEEEGEEVEEGGNGCSTEEMNSRFDELLRLMQVRMMSESKQLKLQQLIGL